MKQLNQQLGIIEALEKGYYVDKHGNLFNPNNRKLKTNIIKSKKQLRYAQFGIKIKSGVRLFIRVHRFIAYMKFGEKIFENGVVVRHLNNDPTDNSWDNIGIGSHTDNMRDKPKSVRTKAALIATSFCRKYKEDLLKDLFKDRFENNMTYLELYDKYSIGKSTLSFLFNKSIFAQKYFKN